SNYPRGLLPAGVPIFSKGQGQRSRRPDPPRGHFPAARDSVRNLWRAQCVPLTDPPTLPQKPLHEGSRDPPRPPLGLPTLGRGSRRRINPLTGAAGRRLEKKFNPHRLERLLLRGRYLYADVIFPAPNRREETMKRALIAIASVGFLASTAWVAPANAQ